MSHIAVVIGTHWNPGRAGFPYYARVYKGKSVEDFPLPYTPDLGIEEVAQAYVATHWAGHEILERGEGFEGLRYFLILDQETTK